MIIHYLWRQDNVNPAHRVAPGTVRAILVALLSLPSVAMAGELLRHQDSETGLLSWQRRDAGFSMRLDQLLPDYVAAVYGARGLPPAVVNIMAGYCVFGTIIRNESQHPISYRVADWRYITGDGKEHPIKTKTDWISEWHDMGVAFRWTVLPDNQNLGPGDWNQGFTMVSLSPDSTFSLVYFWRYQGKIYESIFEELRCAPENLPEE